MSSILTNNSAMVALQTLKGVNANLAKTQNAISTGKSVSSAKDNAAVWAISKVMESDVESFKGISDSLSLGQSTVAVARQGAETVTDLLTQMKGKIVAAQEENVDRDKIQSDIDALRNQINSVVGAAQFNGLNLLSNKDSEAGSGTVNVLASLDRSGSGVDASDIGIGKQDLGTEAAGLAAGATALSAANNSIAGVGDAAAGAVTGATGAAPTVNTTIGGSAGEAVEVGTAFTIAISASATGAGSPDGSLSNTSALDDIVYVARDGDTAADVAAGLAKAFNKYVREDKGLDYEGTISATSDGNQVSITGADFTGDNFSVAYNEYEYDAARTTIGGGLEDLADISVATDDGVEAALLDIEGLLQTSINAAAEFGSAQGRIETQQSFVSGLTDALKSGIGTLVDADMEEASARLQALQVQQQLSVQALSIANQAPQSLLSLFR
ncbi:flagellin [Primorskyibacter sp. S187A]|uniref:flagellin N-terminal helical domain-containing protein n=1 Tax=Primorskyibacter sp. S187A TaxID=3415130 RepID=UPI003C7B241F